MGKIKVIEIAGLDKAGKHTQTKMLKEKLINDGYNTVSADFPDYDSPVGEAIRSYLHGELTMDKYAFELLQSADKQKDQEWINQLDALGVDVVIFDRYTVTEMAYADANNVDLDWKMSLQMNMRQPDHVVFIDIPVEVSMGRKGKHFDGKNDIYEANKYLLSKARDSYLKMLKDKDVVIDGEESVEYISEQIYEFIKTQL